MKCLFLFLTFTPKKMGEEEGSDLKRLVCNWGTSESVFWEEREEEGRCRYLF